MGLIQRLVARVSKHNVQTLTHVRDKLVMNRPRWLVHSALLTCYIQTFMTVSLEDVSSKLQFSSKQEAEKYIRDMVSVL